MPHGPPVLMVWLDFSPPTAKLESLLVESLAFTFGASGFFVSHDDGFKAVVTLPADVFKDRHIQWLS